MGMALTGLTAELGMAVALAGCWLDDNAEFKAMLPGMDVILTIHDPVTRRQATVMIPYASDPDGPTAETASQTMAHMIAIMASSLKISVKSSPEAKASLIEWMRTELMT